MCQPTKLILLTMNGQKGGETMKQPYQLILVMSDQEWLADGEGSQEKVVAHLEKRQISVRTEGSLSVGTYLWLASPRSSLTESDKDRGAKDRENAHVMDVMAKRFRYEDLLHRVSKVSPNKRNLSALESLHSELKHSDMGRSSVSRRVVILEGAPGGAAFEDQLEQLAKYNAALEIRTTSTPKESIKLLKAISRDCIVELSKASPSFYSKSSYGKVLTELISQVAASPSKKSDKDAPNASPRGGGTSRASNVVGILSIDIDDDSESESLIGENQGKMMSTSMPKARATKNSAISPAGSHNNNHAELHPRRSSAPFFGFEQIKDQYDQCIVELTRVGKLGMTVQPADFSVPQSQIHIPRATRVLTVHQHSYAESLGIHVGDWICIPLAGRMITPKAFTKDLQWATYRPLTLVLLREKAIVPSRRPTMSPPASTASAGDTSQATSTPTGRTSKRNSNPPFGAKAYFAKILSEQGFANMVLSCWKSVEKEYPVGDRALVDGIISDSNHMVIKIGVSLSRAGMTAEVSRAIAKKFVKAYQDEMWGLIESNDDTQDARKSDSAAVPCDDQVGSKGESETVDLEVEPAPDQKPDHTNGDPPTKKKQVSEHSKEKVDHQGVNTSDTIAAVEHQMPSADNEVEVLDLVPPVAQKPENTHGLLPTTTEVPGHEHAKGKVDRQCGDKSDADPAVEHEMPSVDNEVEVVNVVPPPLQKTESNNANPPTTKEVSMPVEVNIDRQGGNTSDSNDAVDHQMPSENNMVKVVDETAPPAKKQDQPTTLASAPDKIPRGMITYQESIREASVKNNQADSASKQPNSEQRLSPDDLSARIGYLHKDLADLKQSSLIDNTQILSQQSGISKQMSDSFQQQRNYQQNQSEIQKKNIDSLHKRVDGIEKEQKEQRLLLENILEILKTQETRASKRPLLRIPVPGRRKVCPDLVADSSGPGQDGSSKRRKTNHHRFPDEATDRHSLERERK